MADDIRKEIIGILDTFSEEEIDRVFRLIDLTIRLKTIMGV